MNITMHIVDAFTEEQFGGNSAAVIIQPTWLSNNLMQSIAMENNLSETAFLVKNATEQHHLPQYHIRWFSPLSEIDFCGHATLAAASVVFSQHPEINKITLVADAVGAMNITKMDSGNIQMNFPNRKPSPVKDIPPALIQGLSIKPHNILCNKQAYFAIYNECDDVLNVTQNIDFIKMLAPYDVVVSAPSKKYDFVSRYFWPANGSDEDPVTGSIHTGLAPYWAEQLGKTELTAYQASKRGGLIHCEVLDERVIISGKTVHYLTGVISVN